MNDQRKDWVIAGAIVGAFILLTIAAQVSINTFYSLYFWWNFIPQNMASSVVALVLVSAVWNLAHSVHKRTLGTFSKSKIAGVLVVFWVLSPILTAVIANLVTPVVDSPNWRMFIGVGNAVLGAGTPAGGVILLVHALLLFAALYIVGQPVRVQLRSPERPRIDPNEREIEELEAEIDRLNDQTVAPAAKGKYADDLLRAWRDEGGTPIDPDSERLTDEDAVVSKITWADDVTPEEVEAYYQEILNGPDSPERRGLVQQRQEYEMAKAVERVQEERLPEGYVEALSEAVIAQNPDLDESDITGYGGLVAEAIYEYVFSDNEELVDIFLEDPRPLINQYLIDKGVLNPEDRRGLSEEEARDP